MAKVKIQCAEKAFFYNEVLAYNALPTDTRSVNELDMFQKKLDDFFNSRTWYFNNYTWDYTYLCCALTSYPLI